MKSFLRHHWGRVAVSVIALGVFFGNQGFRSLVGNWLELRRLKVELAQLQSEERRLAERLGGVRGATGLERLARRELGYVKPGEIEYRFLPPRE